MDLTYSTKHQELQAEIRAFIEAEGHRSPKFGGGRNRPDQQALDWQGLLLERGYFARTVPTEYGGHGAEPDVLETAIIADEFSRAGISPGLLDVGNLIVVPSLLDLGSEAQCARWVRPTLTGETIWCIGNSEPGSGSDMANAQTKAVAVGDDFVINGQKIWTSGAHYADMMFLLCRTEAEAPKHKGLSYLLVPMDTDGIEVRPLVTMTERPEFNETFLTDVRVPMDQIVMGRGDGWKVAIASLKHERVMLGDPNKQLQRLHGIREMMRETVIDGVAVMDLPEYRDRLLRLQAEVLAAKFHNMRLLTLHDRGEEPGIPGLIQKLYGTTLNHKLSALAIDVLGEAGLPYEPHEFGENDPATAWQIDYMYDIGLIIGGGTSQIQKNIISERGLGMPREPKAVVPPARS
ncbi:MAG: acyl-CoA dehydrogenase family protein [Alphaproteobacteria bacterium]|jgi:alkylation response protein AidB-like acyl-CoA dehydrogenase|nr:acyl-CoA dehydrogenase family protein [Alphaproteobacteria bacterium]MDP6564042.1 acyl-CoA dehydrogenase family protein [Alphaproteobacteria bacterium]MDP6812239.1 acyl-CoA dehydrogenase family protein [Alphaproteobacteria bacterium]